MDEAIKSVQEFVEELIQEFVEEVEKCCERNIPCFRVSFGAELKEEISIKWARDTEKRICKECYDSGKYLELREEGRKMYKEAIENIMRLSPPVTGGSPIL
jgi:hypothetical protein